MFLSTVVTCRICVIDYLRLIIFLDVIAPRPVMCSLMLVCQCCFAIVKVLLKKVTYLLTYLGFAPGHCWRFEVSPETLIIDSSSTCSPYTPTICYFRRTASGWIKPWWKTTIRQVSWTIHNNCAIALLSRHQLHCVVSLVNN